jgi:hypothetical protein
MILITMRRRRTMPAAETLKTTRCASELAGLFLS